MKSLIHQLLDGGPRLQSAAIVNLYRKAVELNPGLLPTGDWLAFLQRELDAETPSLDQAMGKLGEASGAYVEAREDERLIDASMAKATAGLKERPFLVEGHDAAHWHAECQRIAKHDGETLAKLLAERDALSARLAINQQLRVELSERMAKSEAERDQFRERVRRLEERPTTREALDALLGGARPSINCASTPQPTVIYTGETRPVELVLRCTVTGNPCGTDTIMVGTQCLCAPCLNYAQKFDAPGAPGLRIIDTGETRPTAEVLAVALGKPEPRVIRWPEPPVVGRRYEIVEIDLRDTKPQHKVGEIAAGGNNSGDGLVFRSTIGNYFVQGNRAGYDTSGTYVTALRELPDESKGEE